MSWFDQLLWPLRWAVEWVLVGFHALFTSIGLPSASGWTWTLAIVGLTIVVRAALIPLFVKQIQSSRRMQFIQPEIQKIQAKYKGKTDPESRQAMTEETMALYKRTGTNPFSSCMPILVQMPIFFALFSVLNNLGKVAAGTMQAAGPLTADYAHQIESSSIFGAPLSSTFMTSPDVSTKILTVLLIVAMSLSQLWTQHMLMTKNMPSSTMDNPFMRQQKILMYVLPVVFAVTGVNFPVGVLVYWFVSNLWTAGQQYYVIMRMPAPGSQAEKDLEERRRRAGKEHKKFTVPGLHHHDDGVSGEGATAVDPDALPSAVQDNLRKPSGQRQQPVRRKNKRG